jgi:uncharacterized membrane protein YwaF
MPPRESRTQITEDPRSKSFEKVRRIEVVIIASQLKFSVWNTLFAARHRQCQTKNPASFSDYCVLISRRIFVTTQNIINIVNHQHPLRHALSIIQ